MVNYSRSNIVPYLRNPHNIKFAIVIICLETILLICTLNILYII